MLPKRSEKKLHEKHSQKTFLDKVPLEKCLHEVFNLKSHERNLVKSHVFLSVGVGLRVAESRAASTTSLVTTGASTTSVATTIISSLATVVLVTTALTLLSNPLVQPVIGHFLAELPVFSLPHRVVSVKGGSVVLPRGLNDLEVLGHVTALVLVLSSLPLGAVGEPMVTVAEIARVIGVPELAMQDVPSVVLKDDAVDLVGLSDLLEPAGLDVLDQELNERRDEVLMPGGDQSVASAHVSVAIDSIGPRHLEACHDEMNQVALEVTSLEPVGGFDAITVVVDTFLGVTFHPDKRKYLSIRAVVVKVLPTRLGHVVPVLRLHLQSSLSFLRINAVNRRNHHLAADTIRGLLFFDEALQNGEPLALGCTSIGLLPPHANIPFVFRRVNSTIGTSGKTQSLLVKVVLCLSLLCLVMDSRFLVAPFVVLLLPVGHLLSCLGQVSVKTMDLALKTFVGFLQVSKFLNRKLALSGLILVLLHLLLNVSLDLLLLLKKDVGLL